MRVSTALAVLPLLVAAPLTVAPAARAAPQPRAAIADPGIEVLNVTGTGCRRNTIAVALSPDRSFITVIYSAYLVEAPARPGAASKNCRINLRINQVPGFAPAITSVDYRGFAELSDRFVGELRASYRFHGNSRLETATRQFAGPYSDLWQTTDTAEGGLLTGRCNGSENLDVDSTLTVTGDGSGAEGFVAMDSTDGVVPNTFHLSWRPC